MTDQSQAIRTPATMTSRQVAMILRCTPKHVLRMCDDGDFPGVTLVGRYRRIPVQSVQAYCREAGIPFPNASRYRVATVLLGVWLDGSLAEELFKSMPQVSFNLAASAADAGILVASLRAVHVAVVDARRQCRGDALVTGEALRRAAGDSMRLIGLAAEDDHSVIPWTQSGFDAVYHADCANLAERLIEEARGVIAW